MIENAVTVKSISNDLYYLISGVVLKQEFENIHGYLNAQTRTITNIKNFW